MSISSLDTSADWPKSTLTANHKHCLVRLVQIITQLCHCMWRSTQLERRKMSLEQTEDLKAFERRLTEVIDKLQPTARFWRIILVLISVCTAIGAWTWLWDPNTSKISFHQSLWNHPFFTISCITLFTLFLCGIHKRVVAPSIIASRCRHVLSDYNMSCDDTGKLILLKPRPSI